MEQRRKESRTRVSRNAFVSDIDGRFHYFCLIRDASKTGCSIVSTDELHIPEHFWLYPESFKVPMLGKVAWRRRHMVGVHFVSDVSSVAGAEAAKAKGLPDFTEIRAQVGTDPAVPSTKATERRPATRSPLKLARDYLAVVVHELRTPIASISGALSLIISKGLSALPKPLRDLLLIADRNSKRMEQMVDDLLDAEKLQRGTISIELSSEDLNMVAREAVEANAQLAAMHEVTCGLEAPEGPTIVRIDRKWMGQVLSNLISNAVKFSESGQEVVVRIERIDQTVRTSVIDQGPGIPKEHRERIFEQFEQAEPAKNGVVKGSGLGLSICKSVLQHHGSQIQLNSEPGDGSVFFFDLPEIEEL